MAVVLVTGGSSGIGLATVHRLAGSHQVFAERHAAGTLRWLEDCIEAESPPARAIAGEDARSMVDLVKAIDTEELAGLMRAFVRDLTNP